MRKLILPAAVAVLALAGCGAEAGAPQKAFSTRVALQALVDGCQAHQGVQSYSFRYQSTKYLWTALCKDDTIVVVGGD